MGNKVVDGVELLRKIRDGEIKDRVRIKNTYKHEYIVSINEISDGKIISIGDLQNEEISLSELMNYKFEIPSEEDEEIDIDSIEEIDLFNNGIGFKDVYLVMRSYDNNFKKITDKNNELIRAIKQINKQMEEK